MLLLVSVAAATESEPIHHAKAARAMVGLGTVQADGVSGFEVNFSGMAELGAGVEAGLRVPYASSTDPEGALTASDVAVLLSGAPVTVPVEVRIGAEVNLPLYEVGEGATLLSADGLSAPGDGSVDIDFNLELSKREGPISVKGRAGYRHRFQDFADGVPWWAEVRAHAGALDVGVDLSGHQALWADADTREWIRVGGSLGWMGMAPLRVEVYGGYLPWTVAMHGGWGGGIAVGASVGE